MGERITASIIRQGMLARWASEEYAIMWEVADGTGAGARRYADAVIMSLWPSRGLELHGVEIKVSRSDWRREAMKPQKAEAVGKFCDRWWVHTAPGVVQDTSELPPLWGLREFDGKAWKTRKEAERNPAPVDLTRTFLAAMLRRADGMMRADAQEVARRGVEAERAAIDKRVEDRVKSEVEHRTRQHERLAKAVKEFETETGLTFASGLFGLDGQALGAAVKMVQTLGLGQSYSMASNLRKAAERVIEATAELPPAEAF